MLWCFIFIICQYFTLYPISRWCFHSTSQHRISVQALTINHVSRTQRLSFVEYVKLWVVCSCFSSPFSSSILPSVCVHEYHNTRSCMISYTLAGSFWINGGLGVQDLEELGDIGVLICFNDFEKKHFNICPMIVFFFFFRLLLISGLKLIFCKKVLITPKCAICHFF